MALVFLVEVVGSVDAAVFRKINDKVINSSLISRALQLWCCSNSLTPRKTRLDLTSLSILSKYWSRDKIINILMTAGKMAVGGGCYTVLGFRKTIRSLFWSFPDALNNLSLSLSRMQRKELYWQKQLIILILLINIICVK